MARIILVLRRTMTRSKTATTMDATTIGTLTRTKPRFGTRTVAPWSVLLGLAILAWAAPAAQAQDGDSSVRGMRRAGERRMFLEPVLWQQGRGPGPPPARGPRGRPLPPPV